MVKMLFYLLLIAISLPAIFPYKILGVFPLPGKSHFDAFSVLMRELAKRGHDVTVISHFPDSNPPENYKDVSLKGHAPLIIDLVDASTITHHILHEMETIYKLSNFAKWDCEALGLPQIQNLIKSNQTFDVIIQEQFHTDCFLGLNHVFKAPHIGVGSLTMMSWLHSRMGLPNNPSYIPLNLYKHSDRMTFMERVKNSLGVVVYNYVVAPLLLSRPANYIARKHLGEDLPDLEEIAKNTSVMLLNAHFSINRPRPLPPSVVEVSGLHLQEVKKLPNDLEKYINQSKHGVLYFSMGSMIKGDTFPENVRCAFLAAFAELPQRILWKYENETLPGKPDNVEIRKWMPQYDILSHPNVIAFITHGGLLGTVEAIYNAKPMVAIPIYGDQFTNAMTVAAGGAAIVLEVGTITKEIILAALKKVVEPSYRERAQEMSRVFRDRPQPPLETAVWWVEYIARHRGARHLHSAVIDMPFYQTVLLDVLAFVGVVSAVCTFAIYKVCTWSCSRSRGHKVKIN